ncbi:HD-GYP domain-containing protein [Shewanella woodyi]|uniref:HD-GYP domain-containing protein n=1 Tax=Shewanella woodyi TaxID=60961 RepID=UPI00374A05D5
MGEAAQIVLQHHEQVDGAGYPNHLTGDKICDGAKIIAIADTFDARSHERAHHTLLKRPLVRTMNEINNFSGTQFDPYWVEIFNQVVGESKA